MKYFPFLSLTIVVRDLVLLTSSSSLLIVYCNSLSIDDVNYDGKSGFRDDASSLKGKLGNDFRGVGGSIRGSSSSSSDNGDDVETYALGRDDSIASSYSDFWTKDCYEKETSEGHVLKVYVMAGQSNMLGAARVEHLEEMVNDGEEHDYYGQLQNTTTKEWQKSDKVFCKLNEQDGEYMQVGNNCSNDTKTFGPELGFGFAVDDNDTPILLLKEAWGGVDLAVDFRPPSSGEGMYTNTQSQIQSRYYQTMISNIQQTIDSLNENIANNCGFLQSALNMKSDSVFGSEYWPQSDRIVYDSVQLSGFVWFQGWNDFVNQEKSLEYEFNLGNLIRDVRSHLDVPNLPFVIGEFGAQGSLSDERMNPYLTNRTRTLRQSQYNVTTYPEFYNNTMFVETKQRWKGNEEKLYDQEYHYYGRADTIYHIGEDFGKAMMRLEQNITRLKKAD